MGRISLGDSIVKENGVSREQVTVFASKNGEHALSRGLWHEIVKEGENGENEPTGALNRNASNEVMTELVKLNEEGTTILMVPHDAKVAAKCSRVLYIVDGNIKGEYISSNDLEIKEKDRERR